MEFKKFLNSTISRLCIALFALTLGAGTLFWFKSVYLAKKEFTGYKAIIYDLNGVLVKISKTGVAGEIGLTDSLFYYLFDCKEKTDVQKRLFETLAAMEGYEQGKHIPCSESGERLPRIMCRWMNGGMKDPQKELATMSSKIEMLKKQGFFKNNREYRVMRNTIKTMFHPSKLNKHRQPIKQMLALAREINTLGTCKQCILSNWDKPSFEDFLTTKTGQTLTKVIDEKDIVISADIGCNKPHPDAFSYVMNQHNLHACECIFIDDQIENVEAARKLGMVGLQVKDNNYKEIKEQLTKLGVLTAI